MCNVRESSSDENLDALFNLRENMLKTSYETISPIPCEHNYPLYVNDLFPRCISFFCNLSCDSVLYYLYAIVLCATRAPRASCEFDHF